MRRSIVLMLLVVIAGTLTALTQTVNLRPGKYEKTGEMDLAGTKLPHKDTQCITPEDVKDFTKLVMDPNLNEGCKASGHNFTASKVTFNMECQEDDLRMLGTVEFTFTADAFTSVATMKDNRGRTTSVKTSAKRVGDCVK